MSWKSAATSREPDQGAQVELFYGRSIPWDEHSNSSMHGSKSGSSQSTAERALGVLVGGKLDLSHQCVLAAQRATVSWAHQNQGGIVPLCSALGQPHLQCWGHLGHHKVRRSRSCWRVSKGGTRSWGRSGEQLRALGSFSTAD